MPGHSTKLNPPKTTLRRGRDLFFLGLRTAAWTAVALACALYFINDSIRPAPGKPAVRTEPAAGKSARRTAINPPPRTHRASGLEIADPLALIKGPRAYGEGNAPAKKTAVPRFKTVTFAGSGGKFAALGQDEQEPAQARAENPPRDQEAVLLPASALGKAVKVKGARPVPVSTGKKYSGIDPEAEFLRERMRRQAAEYEAGKVRLRNEKLLLTGWLTLLVLAAMLIPSRVIKAWRLIHKPEGSHWTLR